MPDPIKITRWDVNSFMDHAVREFSSLPSHVRLRGMKDELSQAERRALAYLRASLYVLGARGIATDHVFFDFEHPDSEVVE